VASTTLKVGYLTANVTLAVSRLAFLVLECNEFGSGDDERSGTSLGERTEHGFVCNSDGLAKRIFPVLKEDG
jgi:hypothetical protein